MKNVALAFAAMSCISLQFAGCASEEPVRPAAVPPEPNVATLVTELQGARQLTTADYSPDDQSNMRELGYAPFVRGDFDGDGSSDIAIVGRGRGKLKDEIFVMIASRDDRGDRRLFFEILEGTTAALASQAAEKQGSRSRLALTDTFMPSDDFWVGRGEIQHGVRRGSDGRGCDSMQVTHDLRALAGAVSVQAQCGLRVSACAFLSALALSGCARHDLPKPPAPATARDGRQEIVGTLDVTAKEAAVADVGERVLLVADPPQTALGFDAMLAKTAGALRHLHGRRVRARGDRQGRVLWNVEVVDAVIDRKVR